LPPLLQRLTSRRIAGSLLDRTERKENHEGYIGFGDPVLAGRVCAAHRNEYDVVRHGSAHRPLMRRFAAALLLLAGVGVAHADEVPASANIDPEAISILQRALAPISAAKTLRVKTRRLHDVVQPSGQKLQFGTWNVATLRRPDRVAMEIDRDDGSQRRVYYDGDSLTMHDVAERVYTQFPVPTTLDETLDFLELEVGATLPLADLFYSDLSALGSAASEASVVGTSRVVDWPCDHLAFRGESLDYQVWVERGDQPQLRKLVITYRELPGIPQFGAVFTSWELGVEAPEALFEFVPPEGTERIPTLARPQAVVAEEPR
jgi:hypothetical protein